MSSSNANSRQYVISRDKTVSRNDITKSVFKLVSSVLDNGKTYLNSLDTTRLKTATFTGTKYLIATLRNLVVTRVIGYTIDFIMKSIFK